MERDIFFSNVRTKEVCTDLLFPNLLGSSIGRVPSSFSMGTTEERDGPFHQDLTGFVFFWFYSRRWLFLSALITYVTYSAIKIDFLQSTNPNSFWVYLNTALSVIGTLCYLYTATCNAGVLVSNEDNSIENGDVLEKKGWSYCQICQLYRPVGATHCGDCGVCFERYVCDM